jgi:hypothetical protein
LNREALRAERKRSFRRKGFPLLHPGPFLPLPGLVYLGGKTEEACEFLASLKLVRGERMPKMAQASLLPTPGILRRSSYALGAYWRARSSASFSRGLQGLFDSLEFLLIELTEL